MTRALVVVGACVLFALGVGAFFFVRGPSVALSRRALEWAPGRVDAGFVDPGPVHQGVHFDTAGEGPIERFGVLSRVDAHVVAEDVTTWHAFLPLDGGLLVAGEREVEGPGPSIELYFVPADGAAVVQLGSVPKPHYLASYERLTVDGATWTLHLRLDDEVPAQFLWSWWAEATVLVGPGPVTVVSRNGGRTWRLVR